jgi:hypothetical protein
VVAGLSTVPTTRPAATMWNGSAADGRPSTATRREASSEMRSAATTAPTEVGSSTAVRVGKCRTCHSSQQESRR